MCYAVMLQLNDFDATEYPCRLRSSPLRTEPAWHSRCDRHGSARAKSACVSVLVVVRIEAIASSCCRVRQTVSGQGGAIMPHLTSEWKPLFKRFRKFLSDTAIVLNHNEHVKHYFPRNRKSG